jgi:hypothetical protein
MQWRPKNYYISISQFVLKMMLKHNEDLLFLKMLDDVTGTHNYKEKAANRILFLVGVYWCPVSSLQFLPYVY